MDLEGPDEKPDIESGGDAIARLFDRLSALSDPVNDVSGRASADLIAAPGASVFGSLATRIVANGWSIFPQMSTGERRMPGRVDGDTIKWIPYQKQRVDALTLKKWCVQCGTLNVAMICGIASGDVFAVDIDILDPDLNAKVLDAAVAILGHTPFRRTGKAPKIVLLYRWPAMAEGQGPPASRAFRFQDGDRASSDGIELLSRDKPVTIFGVHHTTGRDFRWAGPTPYDSTPEDVPIATPEQVKDFLGAVAAIRPFYAGAGYDGSGVGEVSWTNDADSDVAVPRLRGSIGGVQWVEDPVSGKVIDGREAYLHSLVNQTVRHNRDKLEDDPSGTGRSQVKSAIFHQFKATAEMSGRWMPSTLQKEVNSRVDHLLSKIQAGTLSFASKPMRHGSGYLTEVHHIAARQQEPGIVDTLSFLPEAPSMIERVIYGGGRQKLDLRRDEDVAEGEIARRREARRLRSSAAERTAEASRTSDAIDKAIQAFLDDLYVDPSERRNVVHLLKTPTGSGKTSRTFRAIARDPRTKHDYQIMTEDGPVTGRHPFLFLLPTYANIDELRSRAKVLNLDPDLDDVELRKAAEEIGLISAEDSDAKIAELRRDAVAAGIETMVYRGKIAAGCRFPEKMSLANAAGISTSGFCRSETRPRGAQPGDPPEIKHCQYHPEINAKEPCPAILQRELISKVHVVFLPHAFMALSVPEELRKVRGVVADERIHDIFLHVAQFPLQVLQGNRPAPRLTKKEKDAGVQAEDLARDRDLVASVVTKAMRAAETPARLEGLRAPPHEDPASAILRACREELAAAATADKTMTPELLAERRVSNAKRCCAGAWDLGKMMTPDLELEQVKQICELPTGIHLREEHRFWSIVLEGIEKLTSSGIRAKLAAQQEQGAAGQSPAEQRPWRDMRIQPLWKTDRAEGEEHSSAGEVAIRISWRTEPNWPDRPLLLLDASAAPEIVCKVLGRRKEDIRVTPLAVTMNVQTVAITDRSYATSHIAPIGTAETGAKIGSAKIVDRVRRFLSILSVAYGWSRVVAGSTIAVRRAVCDGWDWPTNVDWVHFGALRGLDFAKYHAAAVSIGRLEPPVWIVDGVCAALTYDDDEPENPFDISGTGKDGVKDLRLPNVYQKIKMRSGHNYLMAVPGYPPLAEEERQRKGRDSWHQIAHRQYREEEQAQFLGRLRPVYREGEPPVWFCVARILPEEVIVDDVLTLDDMAMNRRFAVNLWEAMRRCDGVLHPDIVAERCHDIYADAAAVRADMNKVGLDDATGDVTASRFAWGLTPVRIIRLGLPDSFAYVRSDIRDPDAVAIHAFSKAQAYKIIRTKADPHLWDVSNVGDPRFYPRTSAGAPARAPDGRVRARLPDKIDHGLGLTDHVRADGSRVRERRQEFSIYEQAFASLAEACGIDSEEVEEMFAAERERLAVASPSLRALLLDSYADQMRSTVEGTIPLPVAPPTAPDQTMERKKRYFAALAPSAEDFRTLPADRQWNPEDLGKPLSLAERRADRAVLRARVMRAGAAAAAAPRLQQQPDVSQITS